MKKLDKLYNNIKALEEKKRFTLQELKTIQAIYNELKSNNKAITFIKSVADYYKAQGCKVASYEVINYIITL